MGKKAKEHRKKVAKRNRIIQQERKRFEKFANQMISSMSQETQSLETSIMDLQNLGGPLMIPPTQITPSSTILSGPQI